MARSRSRTQMIFKMTSPRSRAARRFTAATVTAASIIAVTLPSAAFASGPATDSVIANDARPDLLWYFDALGISAAHEAGYDGHGVTIAVIETAVNSAAPELEGTDLVVRGSVCLNPDTNKPLEIDTEDPARSEHGTNVVSMLIGNGRAGDGGLGARGVAPGATVWFYGSGGEEKTMGEAATPCTLHDPTVQQGQPDLVRDLAGTSDPSEYPDDFFAPDNTAYPEHFSNSGGEALALAARAAIRDGADIISVSMLAGFSDEWEQTLIEANRAGVPIIAGGENPSPDLFGSLNTGVQGLNGTVVVNAVREDGGLISLDADGVQTAAGAMNMGGVAPGWHLLGLGDRTGWGATQVQGTSFATPITAGLVALAMQKYPDATPYQVLQMLIRTTNGGELHEPVWQDAGFGYGGFNAKGMMTTDPTTFLDLNPFALTDPNDPRCQWPEVEEGSLLAQAQEFSDTSQCYYAPGPFPQDEVAYWTMRSDLNAANNKPTASAVLPQWFAPFLVPALIGLGLVIVAGIAGAIIIPLAIRRSRRR